MCEKQTWSETAAVEHAALITDSPGEEREAWPGSLTFVGTGHSKPQHGYVTSARNSWQLNMLNNCSRLWTGCQEERFSNTSFYGKAGNQWEIWFNACFCHKSPKAKRSQNSFF